jgi:hypothetical protein
VPDNNNNNNMKILSFLFIFFVLTSQVNAQVKDSLACSIVEKSLKLIKDYLKEQNSRDVTSRALVVDFLTRLTGISSQSDGDYSGQHSPTNQDYINWMKWYILNENFIQWNASAKKITLKKELILPLKEFFP